MIVSTVNNLLDGAFGPLSAEQTKWLKRLPNHTATLERIITEVLDALIDDKQKLTVVATKLEGEPAVAARTLQMPTRETPFSIENGKETILIVDDEPDVLDVLQEGLKSQGYRTITAKNAEDAFRHAVESKPSLILMDVLLDRQNGIEVCRRIKGALTDFTPVILVTGNGDLRQKVTGSDDEADDLLMKPFQLQELLARVRSMLRMKKLHDQLHNKAA